MLKHIKRAAERNEDNAIAMGLAWTVGVLFCTAAGFYFTNIASSKHIVDLQTKDMKASLIGAALGFLVGVLIALAVTFIYPRWTARDEEHHAHGHHDETEEPGTLSYGTH
jgi:predicted histidine transporter YuiF (NhaC family)